MIAADFREQERFGVPRVGVADDRHVIAERLERLQRVVVDERVIPSRRLGANRNLLAPQLLQPARPCTSSMHTSRTGSGAAARRRPAGTIASSNGKAIVAPTPRRNVRRGICLPVMKSTSLSLSSLTVCLSLIVRRLSLFVRVRLAVVRRA
jgi:hypothetical protein